MRSGEADLIARLRGGDEAAFSCLVHTYSASLKRLAIAFVPSDAVADEVVQETWLAVLTGIDRFEGRSSVKTWIFRILTNRAKTRAIRERRTINFSELADPTREAILDAVKVHGPLSGNAVAMEVGGRRDTVLQVLRELGDEKLIVKKGKQGWDVP